jgi:hypothetical protein
MQLLKLPYVKLPAEFVTLLKSNISVSNSAAPVFDILKTNKSIYLLLQGALKEFDDGRGVEKILLALGWENFRERLASMYIFREIHGQYPAKTSMELVEDIKMLETLYSSHGVHTYSRLFLLGFYLRIADIQVKKKNESDLTDFRVPFEMGPFLRLSQGRTERTDWLILTLWHLMLGLGEKNLLGALSAGKKFEEIYNMLSLRDRHKMNENFLAYGASINEDDIFLYGKV